MGTYSALLAPLVMGNHNYRCPKRALLALGGNRATMSTYSTLLASGVTTTMGTCNAFLTPGGVTTTMGTYITLLAPGVTTTIWAPIVRYWPPQGVTTTMGTYSMLLAPAGG